MRPLLAVVLAASILGGLQCYMLLRPERTSPGLGRSEAAAAGIFSLEMTLTFEAGPDPFALDADDAPSLLVMSRGRELLKITEQIAAGLPVVLPELPDVVVGANEFFVQVSPRAEATPAWRAVRVRILRDGQPIAAQTIWSEPGEPVQGVIRVIVPPGSRVAEGAPDG